MDYSCGGELLGGATLGFGSGGLVAVGDGCGGSISTNRVGEGKGKVAGFFVFEFSFVLSLALRFMPPISPGLSLVAGEAEVFALMFVLTA